MYRTESQLNPAANKQNIWHYACALSNYMKQQEAAKLPTLKNIHIPMPTPKQTVLCQAYIAIIQLPQSLAMLYGEND